jgi:hypothetical protein
MRRIFWISWIIKPKKWKNSLLFRGNYAHGPRSLRVDLPCKCSRGVHIRSENWRVCINEHGSIENFISKKTIFYVLSQHFLK